MLKQPRLTILALVFSVLLGCAHKQRRVASVPGRSNVDTGNSRSFIPAAGQSFYLDLDTAEGAFSLWRHYDLGSLSALRATIRILRIREDLKWAPSFTIFLQDTKTGPLPRNGVGVQFAPVDRKLPLTPVLFDSRKEGT